MSDTNRPMMPFDRFRLADGQTPDADEIIERHTKPEDEDLEALMESNQGVKS